MPVSRIIQEINHPNVLRTAPLFSPEPVVELSKTIEEILLAHYREHNNNDMEIYSYREQLRNILHSQKERPTRDILSSLRYFHQELLHNLR